MLNKDFKKHQNIYNEQLHCSNCSILWSKIFTCKIYFIVFHFTYFILGNVLSCAKFPYILTSYKYITCRKMNKYIYTANASSTIPIDGVLIMKFGDL